MGSKVSKLRGTFRSFRNLARRVVNRQNHRRVMVLHAQVLISSLKLGPLKVRIKRVKNENQAENEEEGERASEAGEEIASNLDIVSGVGTAGDTMTQNTEFDDQVLPGVDLELDTDSDSDFDEEDNNNNANNEGNANTNANPSRLQRLGIRRSAKRHKSSIVSQLAGQILDKFKGEYKTVDLFTYPVNKKNRRISATSLLNHALDCHDAVMELSEQLDFLIDKYSKRNQVQSQTQTLTQNQSQQTLTSESKRMSKTLKNTTFTEPASLIVPGARLQGKIQIPPNDTGAGAGTGGVARTNTEGTDDDHYDDEDDNAAAAALLNQHVPVEHRYSNLDPNFRNMRQDTPRSYDLQIFRHLKNEVNKDYWVGRHQTFEGKRDKQTVIINIDGNDIYYEDYETQCVGLINGSKILGGVHQLKHGQPGFFEKSISSEHTFNLMRSDESGAQQINEKRAKLLQARAARALTLAAWCGSVTSSSRITNEKFTGRTVDWSDVIEDMVWICDEVGATMRRYVQILNEIQFETVADRKTKLESLSEKGISRRRIHELWDAATILLARVRDRDHAPIGAAKPENRMATVENFATKVVGRLDNSYNRFDLALRKAESRVVLSLLRQWETRFEPPVIKKLDSHSFSSSKNSAAAKSLSLTEKQLEKERQEMKMDLKKELQKKRSRQALLTQGQQVGTRSMGFRSLTSKLSLSSLNSYISKDTTHKGTGQGTGTEKSDRAIDKDRDSESSDDEAICICCTGPFEKHREMYVTPCKHAFHIDCLQDWFKESALCPICRKDFSQTDADN